MSEKVENSQGKIFYGMHFYPGVARYEPPGKDPFTVLVNENVIREMGPTFAGRPIFVMHVDEVEQNLNKLREDADGWVIESFYNQVDGKHWAKFILVSDEAIEAQRKGWKLSNAYLPECEDTPGLWNNVPYDRVVKTGEYEHLAIVENPRYEDSIIMSPEQFKAYNAKKTVELNRLSNSTNKKGDRTMKLNIFKRTKVENSVDLDGLVVELPKSKKEVLLTKAVEMADTFQNMNGYANGDHMVKVGDKDEYSVNDLVKKHIDLANEFEAYKTKNEAASDEDIEADDEDPAVENSEADVTEGMEEVGDRGGDEHLNDDQDGEDDEPPKKDKVKNEIKAAAAKKAAIKAKAERLKNANLREPVEEVQPLGLPQDQVARGKSLYGSGN